MIYLKTLSKRKIFTFATIVIILLVTIIVIIAFNKNKVKNDNQNLINAVVEIEKSTYELNTLAINYDEFKQKTNKYLSSYVTSFYKKEYNIYAQDEYVYAITGKHYSEKDWIGLSLDELKKIGEPLSKSVLLNIKNFDYSAFEISKVFEDNTDDSSSFHFSYVFVKHPIQMGNETKDIYIKYAFKKENNKYVLFSIDNILLKEDEKLTYANENVKFEQKINLKQQ